MSIINNPISLFDFEFENYKIGNDILRDLILDEIILNNSADAKKKQEQLKRKFPDGNLEQYYVNQEAVKR